MHRKDAIAWVVSVCAVSLRLSQAKTLAILVASAMRVERISLANIGRAMSGMVKHQIKRCWRFCANDRIETADAMRGVLKRVLKKRKKKLLISFDWTDIKSFQTLVSPIVPARRAATAASTESKPLGCAFGNCWCTNASPVVALTNPMRVDGRLIAASSCRRLASARRSNIICPTRRYGWTKLTSCLRSSVIDMPDMMTSIRCARNAGIKSSQAVSTTVTCTPSAGPSWRANCASTPVISPFCLKASGG